MELLGEPLRQIVSSTRVDFEGSDGGDQVYQLISTTAKAPLSEFTLRDYNQNRYCNPRGLTCTYVESDGRSDALQDLFGVAFVLQPR